MTVMLKQNKRWYSLFLIVFFISCGQENKQLEEELKEIQYTKKYAYIESFTDAEKIRLENWVNKTHDAAEKVLGKLQYDVTYYFHRRDQINDAVSFGYCSRTDSTTSVHLYVNPLMSDSALLHHWIAPHEIAHMFIPRMSKKHQWFFEGFATYLSRFVMIELGTITKEEAIATFDRRIGDVLPQFQNEIIFKDYCDTLLKNHQYPAIYWGGASYFYRVDNLLQESIQKDLCWVITEYQSTRTETYTELSPLLDKLDEKSGTKIFTETAAIYLNESCENVMRYFE